MAMTPEQKARAKQSIQDESNLTWDDIKNQWINTGKEAINAINPNTNRMLDTGAQQQAMPTDPAALAKVKAMMGINPQSMQEHQLQMLKKQQEDAQNAAEGRQLMNEMDAMGDQGFETTAQRAARFNKTKALLGK